MTKGIEEVGIRPWDNVKNTFCEVCTKEDERLGLKPYRSFCWFYEGQWLCFACLCYKTRKQLKKNNRRKYHAK